MTTETTPDAPDPTGLFDLAAQTRQQIADGLGDPRSVYYRRPDLLEAHDRDVAVLLARHGIAEPPRPTPLEIARRQHTAAFSQETPPAFKAMLDKRAAAIEAQGREAMERATAELRTQLSPKEHDRLCELAEAGFPLGADVPRAIFADEHLLRCAAADGAFARAREATRPGGC